jgi:hypothetical protein
LHKVEIFICDATTQDVSSNALPFYAITMLEAVKLNDGESGLGSAKDILEMILG